MASDEVVELVVGDRRGRDAEDPRRSSQAVATRQRSFDAKEAVEHVVERAAPRVVLHLIRAQAPVALPFKGAVHAVCRRPAVDDVPDRVGGRGATRLLQRSDCGGGRIKVDVIDGDAEGSARPFSDPLSRTEVGQA